MDETNLIDNKTLRDQAIQKVEVLDKVKKLLLIPELEVMTIKQVAEYYEVDKDILRVLYSRNKKEIDSDGSFLKSIKDFLTLQDVTLESQTPGKATIRLSDNVTLAIPNRGIRCFSKRAILRIGMLLRDSPVAQEVRTQLLNILEIVPKEKQSEVITNEQQLYLNFAAAAIDGTKEELLDASKAVFDYKNRHIERLNQQNKILTCEILAWDDRSKLNHAIRKIANLTGKYVGMVWNELYKELSYKHHISLKQRGEAPYIQYIKESEWSQVQKGLIAVCERNQINVTTVTNETNNQTFERS